tara:strand:- start:732 stop:1478 length:747 start_codon:yes stop_codon:yes gene_type:complete
MVLKQIKCPPESDGKYGIGKFIGTWLPAMDRYSMDYIGIGEITGSTKNKQAKKVALGENQFISMGSKCGIRSDYGCNGQEKHMYLKSYPIGRLPGCIKKRDGTYLIQSGPSLIGGTGLIGGIQEDLYTIPVNDMSDSIVGKGPFTSSNCMKARLPVGSGLLMGKRKFNSKDEAEKSGLNQAWWIEEKCIPRQPTIKKEYGNEKFEIPFSESNCIKEEFQIKEKHSEKNMTNLLLILASILIFITIIKR